MPSGEEGRPKVSLRKLRESDRELLFRWRNDPWIVSHGSLNRRVSLEEHNAWFSRAVAGEAIRVFVIQVDGRDAGQIRFVRIENGHWEVSVYLMKEYTGGGFGVEAIVQACELMRVEFSVAAFVARALADNAPSRSAFLKAGFSESSDGEGGEAIFTLASK